MRLFKGQHYKAFAVHSRLEAMAALITSGKPPQGLVPETSDGGRMVAKPIFVAAAKEPILFTESDHGYDELAEDQLTAREVVAGVQEAVVVEEYPNYPKGPSTLLLQKDQAGEPIHVVWGIPRGHDKPAVLVTAYRPDPERWDESFMKRR